LAYAIDLVQPRYLICGANLLPALAGIERRDVQYWAHGPSVTLPRLDLAAEALSAATLDGVQYRSATLAERALCLYTWGTTGMPKAANISHRRLLQWSYWFAGLMDAHPTDRLYDCLPMYHSVGGAVAPGAMLVSGGTLVLRERFSASTFWSDVVQERCTL